MWNEELGLVKIQVKPQVTILLVFNRKLEENLKTLLTQVLWGMQSIGRYKRGLENIYKQ